MFCFQVPSSLGAQYVPVSMMTPHPHLPICSAAHVHPCATNPTWTSRVPPVPAPCGFHQFPLASSASVSQLQLGAAQQQLLTSSAHSQQSRSSSQQQSASALRDINLAQRIEYERMLSQHNYMLAQQRLAEAAALPPAHLTVSPTVQYSDTLLYMF